MFDTTFHATMPPEAYTYALPTQLAAQHRIRRYGVPPPLGCTPIASVRGQILWQWSHLSMQDVWSQHECMYCCPATLAASRLLGAHPLLMPSLPSLHSRCTPSSLRPAHTGFHGISYSYLTHEAARMLGKPKEQCNLILCHLGER